MTEYTRQATARFTVSSWNESAHLDTDGEGTTLGHAYFPNRGLTVSDIEYAYHGDVEGTSALKMLIAYTGAGHSRFEGFEHFSGSIGGQEGTCVWQVTGVHADSAVHAKVAVVPGLGTGGLQGLEGEANLVMKGSPANGYELNFSYNLSDSRSAPIA